MGFDVIKPFILLIGCQGNLPKTNSSLIICVILLIIHMHLKGIDATFSDIIKT